MLKELYIENLAVIEKASISFSDKFNAFTGETGAGKSILINGINAVLGQRVTKDIVRTGCDKAIAEALFTDMNDTVLTKLLELGIQCDDGQLILTREIHADGGSVARINSRVSTVSTLKEIGVLLINIYGQHDNQILLSPENHIDILDSYGSSRPLIDDYRESFKELQSIAKRLKDLKKNEHEKAERIEFLSSRIDEIQELDLSEDEDITIEKEFDELSRADKISESLGESSVILYGDDEENVCDMLRDAESMLEQFSDIKSIAPLYERLQAARIEITDIASEITDMSDKFEFNQQRFEYLKDRLSKINSLKRKYGGFQDILDFYGKASEELNTLETSGEEIENLILRKSELLNIVTEKAKKLSEHREAICDDFCRRVKSELEFLDMPNVVIEIQHESGKLTVNGMDNMEILISANKGETPKPIYKIASGGELSRIMLALKTVIADKDSIMTLIFDEIDTGVSGRAAQKIGIKLQEISDIRQVLCVTHLAQIAVMADNHLLIEKKTIGERTSTTVKPLPYDERKYEIARIMGGDNITELMLENAEELLNLNRRKI